MQTEAAKTNIQLPVYGKLKSCFSLIRLFFFIQMSKRFVKQKLNTNWLQFFLFGILTGMKDHKRQIMYGKRPEKTNGKKQWFILLCNTFSASP